MKELGQKWDMGKLVRDVLFVNVQLTEEESPYSPRRDRLTPNRQRNVSNKRRWISSLQETRHAGTRMIQNRIINLSVTVIVKFGHKIAAWKKDWITQLRIPSTCQWTWNPMFTWHKNWRFRCNRDWWLWN